MSNILTITVEWCKNKLGNKFYAVSHAKAVVRGDHTVDDDLTTIEKDLVDIHTNLRDTRYSNATFTNLDSEYGNSELPTMFNSPDTHFNLFTKLSQLAGNMRYVFNNMVTKSMVTNTNVNSTNYIPSSALLYRISQERSTVTSVNGNKPDANGNVDVSKVDFADNLYSSDNTTSVDTYIKRTSGGEESINSGDADLTVIRGNVSIADRVSQSVSETHSNGLTVSIDETVFKEKVNDTTGAYEFTCNKSTWSPSLDDYGITVTGIHGNIITPTTSNIDLDVIVDEDTFVGKFTGLSSASLNIAYTDGDWTYKLADYGITVTGTPADGDTIYISYTAAVTTGTITVNYQAYEPGVITTAKPTSFKSVGLNWFDYENMISGEVGIYHLCCVPIIGGLTKGYTLRDSASALSNQGGVTIGWSTTNDVTEAASLTVATQVTAKQTDMLALCTEKENVIYYVDDASNEIHIWSNDACYIYFFVNSHGSDGSTVCFHPTWSGYEDDTFEAYTESTLEIPTVDKDGNDLAYVTNGLCAVGATRDEINLSNQIYIQKIGVMDYSKLNLNTVEGMGCEFDYDTTKIYYVLETPIETKLASTVDSEYTVADFGYEEFIGTTIAVDATTLYGPDLKHKLMSDVVQISKQTLTATQQQQVRDNIGAASKTDLESLTFNDRRTRNNITINLSNLTKAIAEQNLEKYGYTIGDYFVGSSGYVYHLADMDTYYGGYNSYAIVGTHHCGIVVDTKATSAWLSSGSAGSYSNSTLHSYLKGTVLTNIKSDLTTLFGDWSSHLLSHQILDNSIGTWSWVADQYISALTEVQVYSSRIWSGDNYQQGEGVKPLALFQKFRFNEIIVNTWFWLRSLYSSSSACLADCGGLAGYYSLSNTHRVVGLILFY